MVMKASTNDVLAENGWKAGVEILVILIEDDCQVRVINVAGSGNCSGMRRPRPRTWNPETASNRDRQDWQRAVLVKVRIWWERPWHKTKYLRNISANTKPPWRHHRWSGSPAALCSSFLPGKLCSYFFYFIWVCGGLASNQHFQSFFFQLERVNRLEPREGRELSNVFCQIRGPIKQIIKDPPHPYLSCLSPLCGRSGLFLAKIVDLSVHHSLLPLASFWFARLISSTVLWRGTGGVSRVAASNHISTSEWIIQMAEGRRCLWAPSFQCSTADKLAVNPAPKPLVSVSVKMCRIVPSAPNKMSQIYLCFGKKNRV